MATKQTTAQLKIQINGKEIENTFSAIRKEVTHLERDLKKLPPGTEAFMQKAEELKKAREHFNKIDTEIKAVNGTLQKSEGFFSQFFNSVVGGLTTFEIFGRIKNITGTAITDLLKIADAITAVQKTSGLAQKEVEALFKEFGNFDTRTSRMELMNIAQIGGRLGITDKEQLQEFTREIDKIFVALGDSFQGGLEEVTTKVGKLKNLFDETKNSDYGSALNEIGSALNELGANGTASESNITEFATRIGQLPASLKPAIDKTLGLGAAFEESGIDAEIAASGYSRFMSVAGNDLKGFAQQMKISYQEAQKLFNEKPEEFFIKFGESMKGLSADQTANVLKDLKLNTLEVQKALGAAGDNAGRFREMMGLSSKAMIEGTSISEEFSKVNTNSAAVWEKIGRTIKEFLTDGVVPDFFNWITNIMGKITGITSEAGDGIVKFRERLSFLVKSLIVVTTAVVSYRTALWLTANATKNMWQQSILYNAVLKVKNGLLGIGKGFVFLFAAAKATLAGNTAKATVAMRAFNIAVKMNPVGLLLGAVTAVITAMTVFGNKQKEISQANKDAINSINKEITQLGTLRKMIADNNIPLEKRKELIEKLKQKYPEYLKDIKNEGILTKELADKLNQVNKELILKARLKANEGLIEEQTQRAADAQIEMEKAEKTLSNSIYQFRDKAYMDKYDGLLKGKSVSEQALKIIEIHQKLNRENITASLQGSLKMFNEAKKAFDIEDKKLSELLNVSASLESKYKTNKEEEGDGVTVYGSPKISENPDTKVTKKDYLSDYQNAKKARLQVEQELQKEITQNLEESLDKQLAVTEQKYNDKKFKLAQENIDLEQDIQKLTKEAKTSKDPNLQKTIEEKRKILEINKQIEVEIEKQKVTELTQIQDKWLVSQYEKRVKAQEQSIETLKNQSELEIAQISSINEAKQKLEENGYKEELHKIKTLEDAKKALREHANKKILEATLRSLHLQKDLLLHTLKDISGEAKTKLLEDLTKLEDKIIQVKTALSASSEVSKNSVKGTEAENVDILGFSAGQWETMFNNLDTAEGKINAVGMAMQSLANIGSMYAEIQKNANEKELSSFEQTQNKRKNALKRQLDQGTLSQERYNKEIEKMDTELANKKSEIAYKQAQSEKAMKLFSAIGSTAQAVAQALTAGPILGPILAGIVGALGAVQIGIISSQPLPAKQSYAKGGFTKGIGFTDESGHEVAGVVHKNEYVIPEWMLKDPQIANIAQYLEARRVNRATPETDRTSFAEGGWVAPTDNHSVIKEEKTDTRNLERLLELLLSVLEKIEKEGVDAYLVSDAKTGKEIQKTIKKYTDLVDKNTY